jgi:hypothetical protein
VRRKILILVFLTALVLALSWGAAAPQHAGPDIKVYFSPHGGCTDAVVKELRAKGNLMEVRAGDRQARVAARGHLFWHMNVSRDGRFFAADALSRELWDGPRDEVLL